MEMTAPCSLIEVDRRFRGVYCLYRQDDSPHDGRQKLRSTPMRLHGAIFRIPEGCYLQRTVKLLWFY
jgi:hypothetical protein